MKVVLYADGSAISGSSKFQVSKVLFIIYGNRKEINS